VNNSSSMPVQRGMMKNAILRLIACACLLSLTVSCTTTYDAYGRPQQSVDPVVAAAGIVAAGAIGYAIANDNGHGHYNNRYRNSGYRNSGYRNSGYRNSGYGYGGYRGGYRGGHCH